MRAPSATWVAWSEVFFRGAPAGSVIEDVSASFAGKAYRRLTVLWALIAVKIGHVRPREFAHTFLDTGELIWSNFPRRICLTVKVTSWTTTLVTGSVAIDRNTVRTSTLPPVAACACVRPAARRRRAHADANCDRPDSGPCRRRSPSAQHPPTGQGITQPKQGKGGSVVQGAAGTSGSKGDKGLEHCDKPMGAMAVVEPQDHIIMALARYQLQSPSGLIRMMIQQSNCFIVVERGVGMQNMMQERQLSNSGQLRQSSNVGGGQMVAADFILTPAVVFSENNAGGVGRGVAGLFGGAGRAVGAVAGGLKFKEAQTSMLVADSRSGVQVAAAEGSTRKADLNLGGALFGGGAGGAVGGYGNTNEGKIIAAALLDNYNKIVGVVRGDPTLAAQRRHTARRSRGGRQDHGRRRVRRRRRARSKNRQGGHRRAAAGRRESHRQPACEAKKSS